MLQPVVSVINCIKRIFHSPSVIQYIERKTRVSCWYDVLLLNHVSTVRLSRTRSSLKAVWDFHFLSCVSNNFLLHVYLNVYSMINWFAVRFFHCSLLLLTRCCLYIFVAVFHSEDVSWQIYDLFADDLYIILPFPHYESLQFVAIYSLSCFQSHSLVSW